MLARKSSPPWHAPPTPSPPTRAPLPHPASDALQTSQCSDDASGSADRNNWRCRWKCGWRCMEVWVEVWMEMHGGVGGGQERDAWTFRLTRVHVKPRSHLRSHLHPHRTSTLASTHTSTHASISQYWRRKLHTHGTRITGARRLRRKGEVHTSLYTSI